MTQRPVLFYPGRGLSAHERARVDAFDLSLEEVTVDHIAYSLGRALEINFANLFGVAAEMVGPDTAREIAFAAGRRHGGGGYARLLAAHGTPGRGSPRLMALYQDLAHALRGPKHSLSLFAEYDDQECLVTKPACGYYDAQRPEAGPYVGAFEAGCFEGYRAVDQDLEAIDVLGCCWRGDDGCRIRLRWRTPSVG